MLWGISDPTVESVLLSHANKAGIDVRRRCVDAVELVAACTVSAGAPVLVHMDLPRLSREVLGAIMDHTREVTIITSTDQQYALATSWGFGRVIHCSDSKNLGPMADALFSPTIPGMHTVPGMHTDSIPQFGDQHGTTSLGAHVVCMWSATGSTGRSTLALGLSEAWARSGERVLLIDADTYSPSLATALGITDDLSGIVVACRYVDQNSLDQRSLTSACRELKENLWILTGLSDPQRWSEVGGASLASVIERAREFFDRVVLDIAPIVLETPEPLGGNFPGANLSDPLARLRPVRNAAGAAALQAADTVLVVIRPDVVGALRLVHDFGAGRRCFPNAEPVFLVNRVPTKLRAELQREFGEICAGLTVNEDRGGAPATRCAPTLVMIPEDSVALAMVREGATMAETKVTSKIFISMKKLADELGAGVPGKQSVRRSRGRKNHHKITDFGPFIKLLGIFGRHANTPASSNR